MNNINITKILKNIDFVSRYQKICSKYNDFDNSLQGNRKELYDKILSNFNFKIKYFSREKFYRIISHYNDLEFGLQLVLKDGIVEPMIDIKKGDLYLSPDGRFDFIPEKMGVEFNREKYNLPKYNSEEQLEDILKEIFSLYRDIIEEVIKEFYKDKNIS